VLVGLAISVGLIAWYIVGYVWTLPPTVAISNTPGSANLTLMTVASYGHPPHPDWVSYLVKNKQGTWTHSTIWQLPANSTIHVTVLQYDGDSGLRNPFLSQPRGIIGNTMSVDGHLYHVLPADDASHTFTVPDLGISVPLKGVADTAPNQCTVAPCSMSEAHVTIKFSFHTGKKGWYRWQCFVPCAAGWIFGNGGPMQTVGWMDGYLKVV
jgi:hypothetical protein